MKDETLIDPALLEADLQERLECLEEVLKEESNLRVVGYIDGQMYALEYILSDIRAGLWRKGI